MGGTGLSPAGQQLGGMTDRMMEVRAQRLGLESAVAQIKTYDQAYAAATPWVGGPPASEHFAG